MLKWQYALIGFGVGSFVGLFSNGLYYFCKTGGLTRQNLEVSLKWLVISTFVSSFLGLLAGAGEYFIHTVESEARDNDSDDTLKVTSVLKNLRGINDFYLFNDE